MFIALIVSARLEMRLKAEGRDVLVSSLDSARMEEQSTRPKHSASVCDGDAAPGSLNL